MAEPAAEQGGTTPRVIATEDRGVVQIMLRNPEKLNALTTEIWVNLRREFQSLTERRDIRCVVVMGAGTDAFAAGADISEFEALRNTRDQVEQYREETVPADLDAIAACDIPVVAAIRGAWIGGGSRSHRSAISGCAIRPLGWSRRSGDSGSRWRLESCNIWFAFWGRGPSSPSCFCKERSSMRCGPCCAQRIVSEVADDARIRDYVESHGGTDLLGLCLRRTVQQGADTKVSGPSRHSVIGRAPRVVPVGKQRRLLCRPCRFPGKA